MSIIILDPGHGGEDPGCQHHGIVEKTFAYRMAQAVGEILRNFGDDLQVVPTRGGDWTFGLSQRCLFANSYPAELFLSIHVNANDLPGPRGMWVIYADTAPKRTMMLAETFTSVMCRELKGLVPDGWVAQAKTDLEASGHGLTVLRSTNMPALLVECGFSSNEDDARLLKQPAFRAHLASALAIAAGLCVGWGESS